MGFLQFIQRESKACDIRFSTLENLILLYENIKRADQHVHAQSDQHLWYLLISIIAKLATLEI